MRLLRAHPMLTGWLFGLATVALIGAVAGVAVVFGGLYDTGADTPHSRPFSWAVHRTMISSVRRRAAPLPPPRFDDATLLAGMSEYDAHCMACHGGPGIDRARWARAMEPTPPFLLGSAHRWSRAELNTIVRDGVKMTGMPAWGEAMPPGRIDAVVTLLQAMPRMTPAQFAALRARAAQQEAPQPGSVRLMD